MNFIKGIFTANPGPDFNYYVPVLILSTLLIIGSIVFSQYYKQKKQEDFAFKRLFRKTANQMLIFGLLFLVLMALRYEAIPYFAMRLWLYITFAVFIYWAYKNIQKYRVKYPVEKINAQRKTAERPKKSYSTKKKRK